jgi:hypothetical protein
MRIFTPTTLILCTAILTVSACDPAEFDTDPDVRRDARANRKCVLEVQEIAKDPAAQLNTTLPIVEINQYIIDAPTQQERWMCRTDDEGNPTQLYKLGDG